MEQNTLVTEEIVLREKKHEYDHVYTFIFDTPNPILSNSFQAGQYVHVRLPNVREGEKSVRELSFASAPNDVEIQLGVDTRSGSPYQSALVAMEPGDIATLFKVKGTMVLPEGKAEVVMIAGGVGITPFRSMVREIAQKNLPITVVLVHVSREHFLYQQELEKLPFEQHRVNRSETQSMCENVVKQYPQALYFIAGSENFVQDIENILVNEKIGSDAIFKDEFKGLHED